MVNTKNVIIYIWSWSPNNKSSYLQVFKSNPAKYLYERLGFTVYGETETHYQMEISNIL